MFVSFIRKGKQCQQPCRYLVRSHSVVSTAHLPLWSLGLCHLLGLQGPCGLSQLPSSGQPISIFPGDVCHVDAEFKERDCRGCQCMIWTIIWESGKCCRRFTGINCNTFLFPPYFCHLTVSGYLSGPFLSWPMTSWPKSGPTHLC